MIPTLLFALHYRRFLRACADPLAAQAQRLRSILCDAAATEIGRAADFRGIAGIRGDAERIRAFQHAVPVRGSAALQQELAAVYDGRWRTLCPSPPLFFSMTAGSTGRYKYIPVTAGYLRELRRGSQIFCGALEAALPGLRGLQTQFLAGSAEGGFSTAGVPQGFASGFNYRNLPRTVRGRFILPYWVFTLCDAGDRAYAAGRILAGQRRLGALGAISPVNLINLRVALEERADLLCDDIARGTLTVSGPAAVPGTYRTRPDPALARALRAGRGRTGRLPDSLLFPALQALVCWQGGSMGYYLDELEAQFGPRRRFEFPISASEGIFAVPHRADRAGGILAVTTHFLEFLPEDGDAAEPAHALRADQLEAGREYGLVVTNAGGLYRYDMEDIVRVTGFHARTPVIEFVSKRDRRVSVANERITELDVTTAMHAACRACDIRFPEFLFVPCSDRRYRVLVDGAAEAARSDRLDAFAHVLDRELRRASMGYDFERDDALLAPAGLVVTAPGALRAWLRAQQPDHDLPSAQAKPLHLCRELDLHTRFSATAGHAV
jgi:hypothetical protein